MSIFTTRDGVDVPNEGHFRFLGSPTRVERAEYANVLPSDLGSKDLLWEVAVEPDE